MTTQFIYIETKVYHVRLLCWVLRLTAIRDGVKHSVLHKNADCSTYEGGEEVDVYVVACAVETPDRNMSNKCHIHNIKWRNGFNVFVFLLEVAENGNCNQQGS